MLTFLSVKNLLSPYVQNYFENWRARSVTRRRKVSTIVKTVLNGCRGTGRQVSEIAQDDPTDISKLLGDLSESCRGREHSIGCRDVEADLFDSSSSALDTLV